MNRLILAGNPNCGKTTLYNRICAESEPVGNRAGVTVVVKQAKLRKKYGKATVADLPGMYSLESTAADESNAARYIAENSGVIINIIDAADIARGLMLFCELRHTGHNVIIALNMIDEANKRGTVIDIAKLEKITHTRVFPVSAANGYGINELLHYAVGCNQTAKPGDILTPDERMKFGKDAADNAVKPGKSRLIDDRIDRIICRPSIGIPLYIATMTVVILLSFSTVGGILSDGLTELFDYLSDALKATLLSHGCNNITVGLLCDGALGGIGAVCSFLPQSAIMYILLEMLDDIGYLSRAAFAVDGFMRNFGLDGKSFIPLILGMGCTVPAVITADALPPRERKKVVAASMFIPCGARFPVMLFVLKTVCGRYTPIAVSALYFLGFATAFLSSIFSKSGRAGPTVTELTRYRAPTARNLFRITSAKIVDFVSRSGSVVVLCSIVIYILSHLNICMQYCEIDDSILFAAVGKIAPVMRPVGLGDVRVCSALVCGMLAKETIISALTVTGFDISSLGLARAVSLCVFSMLYCPCAATFSTVASRHGSGFAVKILITCMTVAYAVSLIFYTGFSVFG
ncbi:MAG: ferrous iron transporter B [Clostridia bacterium]|nr:ferrous iron transporter B [Clostridia bacterium]